MEQRAHKMALFVALLLFSGNNTIKMNDEQDESNDKNNICFNLMDWLLGRLRLLVNTPEERQILTLFTSEQQQALIAMTPEERQRRFRTWFDPSPTQSRDDQSPGSASLNDDEPVLSLEGVPTGQEEEFALHIESRNQSEGSDSVPPLDAGDDVHTLRQSPTPSSAVSNPPLPLLQVPLDSDDESATFTVASG